MHRFFSVAAAQCLLACSVAFFTPFFRTVSHGFARACVRVTQEGVTTPQLYLPGLLQPPRQGGRDPMPGRHVCNRLCTSKLARKHVHILKHFTLHNEGDQGVLLFVSSTEGRLRTATCADMPFLSSVYKTAALFPTPAQVSIFCRSRDEPEGSAAVFGGEELALSDPEASELRNALQTSCTSIFILPWSGCGRVNQTRLFCCFPRRSYYMDRAQCCPASHALALAPPPKPQSPQPLVLIHCHSGLHSHGMAETSTLWTSTSLPPPLPRPLRTTIR